MKKVIFGLGVGLLLAAISTGTAYSHERDCRDEKVMIKTGPRISVNLPSLGINVNLARGGAIWVPGHWQRADYRRGYFWVPGRWEKKAKYYPQYRHEGYCRR